MQLRPWIKNTIRMVAFSLVLLVVVQLVGHYLMPHSNRYLTGYTAGGIIGEDFDTIDVLVMGDSNAAQSVASMDLYSDYGVTSYTYAEGWLSVFSIYYRLRTIYQEQAPKVVVLATAPLFTQKPNETYLEGAIGDIAGELLPLMRFHDNWKTLQAGDLLKPHDYTWRDINKGFTPITGVGACMSEDYMRSTGVSEQLPTLTEFFLDRIAALCEENGSQLLLVTVPCARGWNLARHIGTQEYADANGMTYIDYNMPGYEIGIDWHTDTPDGGTHLNVLGARKTTKALGEYLMQNYTLEDHRGQPGYEDWDSDLQEYIAEMANETAEVEANAAVQLEALGENEQK